MFGKKKKQVEEAPAAPPPPPPFKYGGDESKETDAFIANITSAAPRNTSLPPTGNTANVQKYYSDMQPLVASEHALGCSGHCFRLLLILFNMAFFLGGGAGAIGIVVVETHDTTSFLTVCTECKKLIPFFIVACSVIGVIGLLGLAASFTRNKCIIIVYNFLQILLLLVFFAWTIAVIIAITGYFDSYVASGWNSSASSDASTICGIEHTLQCSGWDNHCVNATMAPTPTPTSTSTLSLRDDPTQGPLPQGCPKCTNPDDNSHPNTCHSTVTDSLHSYFTYLLVTGIAGCVVSIICVVMTWKIRRVKKFSY